VFDGIRHPDNEDIKYYYPTNDLVTAPEILFFWVARMIMAGLEYRHEVPFKNVYLTGIVRDKQGRKMSKSLGNSPDPIELIEKYGADGVRVGMLLTSPAGNDLPFDEILCEQGRNFSNKIWNALRLVKGWDADESMPQPEASKIAVDWFGHRMNDTLKNIEDHFDKYRISDALMSVYKLVWDDFCSWYLEMIKPPYQKSIDAVTLKATIGFFEELMRILHPFMPFITEEIWHHLAERNENECLMVAKMPSAGKADQKILTEFEFVREVIMGVRNVRKDKNIPNKDQISLFIKKNEGEKAQLAFDPVVKKLCNLSELSYTEDKVEGAVSFIIRSTEYYIPLEGSVDVEAEIEKLESELKYTKGFLIGVDKKLSNERFVNNAPEDVVVKEKQKKADAEARIRVIEEQLITLRK
jgi:valyl-tRNA synthetase